MSKVERGKGRVLQVVVFTIKADNKDDYIKYIRDDGDNLLG